MLKLLAAKTSFDRISIMLSSLCILHCLLTPFFILLLPALSEFFSETLERTLVLAVIPVSLAGFLPAWIRHKNFRLLRFFIAGLSLIIFSQFFMHIDHNSFEMQSGSILTASSLKSIVMFLGAFLLAWSVFKNKKHTHVCNHRH